MKKMKSIVIEAYWPRWILYRQESPPGEVKYVFRVIFYSGRISTVLKQERQRSSHNGNALHIQKGCRIFLGVEGYISGEGRWMHGWAALLLPVF
jgi:hypothetical protein